MPAHGRLDVARDGAAALMVLRLGEGTVVCGPPAFLASTTTVDVDALGDHTRLLSLVEDLGARPLGGADLFYGSAGRVLLPPVAQGFELQTDEEGSRSRALELACSQDDVDEVGLSENAHRRVLTRNDGTPLAGAGYVVWADDLAHVGVLTHPDARGRGFGRAAVRPSSTQRVLGI